MAIVLRTNTLVHEKQQKSSFHVMYLYSALKPRAVHYPDLILVYLLSKRYYIANLKANPA